MKVEGFTSKRDWFDAQHGYCWLCGTLMNFKYGRKDGLCATFDRVRGTTWDPRNLLLGHQDCCRRRDGRPEIICLSPPHPPRRLLGRDHWRHEILPDRAVVYRAWTRAWMIDKKLVKP